MSRKTRYNKKTAKKHQQQARNNNFFMPYLDERLQGLETRLIIAFNNAVDKHVINCPRSKYDSLLQDLELGRRFPIRLSRQQITVIISGIIGSGLLGAFSDKILKLIFGG